MSMEMEIHTEVKIDDRWHHYGSPRVRQDYELFTILGAATGDDHIGFPIPRVRHGLPDNPSELTQFSYVVGIGNHADTGWIDQAEIAVLQKWYENREHDLAARFNRPPISFVIGGDLFGADWGDFLADPGSLPHERVAGLTGVRWIFWFYG